MFTRPAALAASAGELLAGCSAPLSLAFARRRHALRPASAARLRRGDADARRPTRHPAPGTRHPAPGTIIFSKPLEFTKSNYLQYDF